MRMTSKCPILQESLRKCLHDCTLITIAHRLDTVMNYDKILVLQDGEVVEFDKPEALLRNEGGCFAELYRNAHAKEQ